MKTPPRRGDFPYFMEIQTRWNDNDQLRHVNNVQYYAYFEAVIVKFVVEELGLDWTKAPLTLFTVENLCRFRKPLAFPEIVTGGLRIERIGNTSFTYGLALFRAGEDEAAADGHWVHVVVTREAETPTPIPAEMRTALERFS